MPTPRLATLRTPGTPAAPAARFGPPLLFAASGAAGLVLEVVWTRWLVLAVGASARATTLVLAVFMGGLGVGAWVSGRFADRRAGRTLRLFAAAEALIGAWSLLSIAVLGHLVPGLAGSVARIVGASALPLPLRAVLATLALAPPTVLMGATLPLLARWVVSAGLLPGRGIGVLYTLNTLGGVLGALAAPFVLIDRLGLSGAAAAAGAVDVAVAAGALLLARAHPLVLPPDKTPTVGPTVPPSTVGARVFAVAALAYFASGFIGLALEVVTHRVLSVLAGSSVYAFAVMLAAFLVGIAGGAAVAAWVADRVREPLIGLGFVLAALAAGIGLAQRLLAGGGWAVAGRFVAALPGLNAWAYGFELAACLVTLLPATLMLGAAVPLVARIAAGAPAKLAARFGAAYALNTAGAVLGAALGGLVLVPMLGTAHSLVFLTALAGMAGVAVVLAAGPGLRAAPLTVAALLAAAGLALGWGGDPVRRAIDLQVRGRTPLAFREGPVQTIAVVAEDNDQQLQFLRLITNKTSLTGTHLYARRYMTLLGHLPALWGPPPRAALVICFGTGMTASALATYPSVDRLDIAEISPEVIEVEPLFEAANARVLADPRVRLHVEDGRHVLLAARELWDLITLEPPPPRDSGVVSLYTTDFYELCRRRLAPGGVVAQWCPLHSQSLDEARMVVGSFLAVFPYVIGFLPVERDLILLGGDRPLVVDPASLGARMATPAVRDGLAVVGFSEAADVLATAVADRAALLRFAGDASLVTDDRPRLELFARFGKRPLLFPVSQLADSPPTIDELVGRPPSAAFRERFANARAALSNALRGVWAHEAGHGSEGDQLLLTATQLRPADPYYLWAAGLSDEHLRRLRARAASNPGAARPWIALAVREVQRGLNTQAADSLRRALAASPEDPEVLYRLGMLLVGPLGQSDDGRALLARFLDRAPGHPAAGAVRRLLAASSSR